MRWIVLTALILAGCAQAPVAPPAEPLTEAEMNALLSEATTIAAETLGYERIDPPAIKVLPSIRAEYRRMYGEDHAIFDAVAGYYDWPNRTIWVHDWLDLHTVDGRGLVAHEIAHYLQFQNGFSMDSCRYIYETGAYRVQFRYHAIKGEPVDENPGVVAMRLYGTRCD